MRERPILFSAPMVRALLSGKKTQTRRIAKIDTALGREALFAPRRNKKYAPTFLLPDAADLAIEHCPYGQPGDQLWVRETWRIGAWDDHGGFWLDYCDGPRKGRRECQDVGMADKLADQNLDDLKKRNIQPTIAGRYEWNPGASPLRWRPSIHMPRWASRTTLGITGVRVERLHDISEADAIAEGVCQMRNGSGCWVGSDGPGSLVTPWPTARDAYGDLWDQIKGQGAWAANPWVWVVEFNHQRRADGH